MSLYNYNHIEWIEKKKELWVATGNLFANRHLLLKQVSYPIELVFISSGFQLVERISQSTQHQYIEGSMVLAHNANLYRIDTLADLYRNETLLGKKINQARRAFEIQYHAIRINHSGSLTDEKFRGSYYLREKQISLSLNESLYKIISQNIMNGRAFWLQIHLNCIKNTEGIFSINLPTLAQNFVINDNSQIPIHGAGSGALKTFSDNENGIEVNAIYIGNTSQSDKSGLIGPRGNKLNSKL